MHPLNTTYYLGLDLGQAHDPSALALLEHADLLLGRERLCRDPLTWEHRTAPRLALRHLRRWPLGTPYTQVVADVARTVHRLQPHPVHLVVDATGVGAPVVDLLRTTRTGAHLVPVVITGAPHAHEGKLATHVPKHELIRGLQLLLEKKELTLAAGLPLAEDLRRELAAFELKPTHRGSRSGAAHGEHDDLVMALALAVWRSQHGPQDSRRATIGRQERLL